MRSTRNKYVGVSSPASGEIPRRRQTLSSDALYDVFHNAGRQGASPFAGTRRHLMSAQGLAQRDDATSSCASCFVVRVTKTRGCALHSRIVSEPGYLFTVGVEMEGHYVRSPSGHQGQTRREVGTQSLRSVGTHFRALKDSGVAEQERCRWNTFCSYHQSSATLQKTGLRLFARVSTNPSRARTRIGIARGRRRWITHFARNHACPVPLYSSS